jgi:TolB protein
VSNRDGNKNIYAVDVRSGKEERLTDHDADDMDPDWSPDGKKIVFSSRRDGKDNLYLLELADKKVTRLTEHGGRNILADWSPDGKKLAFTSNRLLGWSVYLLDLETKEISKVVSGHGACRPRWSPDGEWLTLVSQQEDGKGDIFVVRPDGSGLKQVTPGSKDYDYFPAWAQEGRFVVYAETENKKNGPWDLAVTDVGTGKQWKLTDTPHSESFPDWHEGG